MPTATQFTALGKGNGFNRCLTNTTVNQVLNAPTLKQTMAAYWNFDSATFGEATFNPNNKPKDIICDEFANRGDDFVFDSGDNAYHLAYHVIPAKCNGNIYIHGIGFTYQQGQTSVEGHQSIIVVDYRSTVAAIASDTYDCETLYTSTSGGGSYSYGKSTTAEKTLASTSVDIDGFPFVRTVYHEFYGETYDDPVGSGNAPCLTPFYLPEPTTLPSLSFHTY